MSDDGARAARAALGETVAGFGLGPDAGPGVAMVSGGPDSAALLAGLVEARGPRGLIALHVDHGLRADSAEDAVTAAALCEQLGVALRIERVAVGAGNLQASARDARYAAAERLRAEVGAGWVATGHTRSDLVETVLYRLVSSPGVRSLLALPARRGTLRRPLISLGRKEVRELAVRSGLPFRDDPTNRDLTFARNRIRAEVLPVLEAISPGLEATVSETRAELGEDDEALASAAREVLAEAGAGRRVRVDPLLQAPPAVARRALRLLAERAAGRPVALGRARAREILKVAGRPQGGSVELGRGLRAVCEAGTVGIATTGDPEPDPVRLSVPGRCRFGPFVVEASVLEGPVEPRGPDVATLDADRLGGTVTVRPWREGDRMRPLGLGGTKSLQDVFTDAGVPRSLRRSLPVVEAEGEVAWVAGVAASESFRIDAGTPRVAVIEARAPASGGVSGDRPAPG